MQGAKAPRKDAIVVLRPVNFYFAGCTLQISVGLFPSHKRSSHRSSSHMKCERGVGGVGSGCHGCLHARGRGLGGGWCTLIFPLIYGVLLGPGSSSSVLLPSSCPCLTR